MGRGQGPQGGAGNQGGALSSKSAKSRKPKARKNTNFKKTAAQNDSVEDDQEEPAYTVIRPDADMRLELIQRTRNDEKALKQLIARKAAIARMPVNGTAPSGEVLGGDVASDLHGMRHARLHHLDVLRTTRKVEKACCAEQKAVSSTSTLHNQCTMPSEGSEKERKDIARMVANLSIIRRTCEDFDHNDVAVCTERMNDLRELVDVLLDMLAVRLTQEELDSSINLLHTVLTNAKKNDPKYHRLKATNDRLWRSILQQPELCALIEASGFKQHHTEVLEEMDKCEERDHLQTQLQIQLESAESPTQMTVEALLLRLDELQIAAPPTTKVLRLRLEGDLAARTSVFVHPGSIAMQDLDLVLEATLSWRQDLRKPTQR